MKKIKLIILTCLFLIPAIFHSCSKERETDNCNCNTGEKSDSQLKFILGNNAYNFEGVANKYVYQGYENIAVAIKKGNENISDLLSSIDNTRRIDTGIAIYIYCNRIINSDDTITDNDIVGLSTYNVISNKLYHSVYKKHNNEYELIYFYETDSKNLQQIKFILNYRMTDGGEGSFVSIMPYIFEPFTLNNPCDQFRMIEPDFCFYTIPSSSSKSTLESQPGPGGCNCGGLCSVMANMKCVESFLFPGEYFCDQCGCASNNQIAILIEENVMSIDSVYMAYDTTLQYNLRDNFFINYEIGAKYTNYYYSISEFLGEETIPISLMLETAEFLIDFNSRLEMLLDTTGNSNKVLINSTMKTRLIDLIDDYKNLSSNQNYIDALNDIKSDIHKYSGKTLGYILDAIE